MHWTSFSYFPKSSSFRYGEESKVYEEMLTCFLGYGYGQNAADVTRERSIEAAVERLNIGDGETIEVHHIDYGDQYEGIDGGDRWKTHNVYDILLEAYDDAIENRWDFDKLRTKQELFESYIEANESDWGRIDEVCTAKKRKQNEMEKWRSEMEEEAGAIARKYNITTGSMKFFQAVEKELKRVGRDREDWNNPERRMEEWMDHTYAGTREAYFDDLNYVNGKIWSEAETLRDILRWAAQSTPLLWARYRELKARKKRNKKNG